MKKISFLLAFFMMIGAATFAATPGSRIFNVENPVVKKSQVLAATQGIPKTQSCTVTVTTTNADGSTASSTATYTCETCTASQACAAAYAAANAIIKV